MFWRAILAYWQNVVTYLAIEQEFQVGMLKFNDPCMIKQLATNGTDEVH